MKFEIFVNDLSKKLKSGKSILVPKRIFPKRDEANVQTFAYLSISFASVETVLLDCEESYLEVTKIKAKVLVLLYMFTSDSRGLCCGRPTPNNRLLSTDRNSLIVSLISLRRELV